MTVSSEKLCIGKLIKFQWKIEHYVNGLDLDPRFITISLLTTIR